MLILFKPRPIPVLKEELGKTTHLYIIFLRKQSRVFLDIIFTCLSPLLPYLLYKHILLLNYCINSFMYFTFTTLKI